MSKKKVWIGSMGPLLFEDTDSYPGGSVLQKAGMFEGPIHLSQPASNNASLTGNPRKVGSYHLQVSSGSSVEFLTELQPFFVAKFLSAYNQSEYGEFVAMSNPNSVDGVHDLKGGFTTTPGSTGSVNFYYDGSTLTVENQTNSTQAVSGIFFEV